MDTKNEGDKHSGDFVSALSRGLNILECFTSELAVRQQGRLTLSEAAKLTGLSRGTSRRLLLTLNAINYVDTDGKNFWLTPKLLTLAQGFVMPIGLGSEARAILSALTQKLDNSASIGVLDGGEVVYIERVEVQRLFSSVIVTGTRLPAAATSLGRVLLAPKSDREIEAWLTAYPLVKRTEKTITTKKKFFQEIERTRTLGYALIDEEVEIGLRSVAVPIRSADGTVKAAINAVTSSLHNSVEDIERKFVPALKEAAEKLSVLMNW